MVEELEEIERGTDRMQITVRRELYRLEKELPPVDVMFLYKIIDWIGDEADRAERVGNRLVQLLARCAPASFLVQQVNLYVFCLGIRLRTRGADRKSAGA